MTEQKKQNDNTVNTESAGESKKKEEDIFETTEIKIEEMAIDGICGVY